MTSQTQPLTQLLYVSTSNPSGAKIDLPKIVEQSRHNNALDGVSGLLWSDGKRFLQVLEGPAESVSTTFDRIKGDTRHHAIVVLHQRAITEREFGTWTMAQRRADDTADDFDAKMQRLLRNASETVRGTFLGLIAARS
jgi:hypothetical protein